MLILCSQVLGRSVATNHSLPLLHQPWQQLGHQVTAATVISLQSDAFTNELLQHQPFP